jgi:hypothetical protein
MPNGNNTGLSLTIDARFCNDQMLYVGIQKVALGLFSVYTNDRKQGKRNLIKGIYGCAEALNISGWSRDRKGEPGLIRAKSVRLSCSGLYMEDCQNRTESIQHIF